MTKLREPFIKYVATRFCAIYSQQKKYAASYVHKPNNMPNVKLFLMHCKCLNYCHLRKVMHIAVGYMMSPRSSFLIGSASDVTTHPVLHTPRSPPTCRLRLPK